MPKEILQIVIPAFIGAASGYFINQLPPLGNFRGSRWLVVAVVIELAVLGAISAWLTGDTAQTSNMKGLVEKIAAVFFGAFLVNVLQLLFANLRSGGSVQSSPPPVTPYPRTVVKQTTLKGERNKARITQKDVLVENTQLDGQDNEFSVTDDGNSSSSQQNHPHP